MTSIESPSPREAGRKALNSRDMSLAAGLSDDDADELARMKMESFRLAA